MTTIELPEPPAETRRDRWGRYLVTPPEGGKPVGYSRATTVAKALDDTSALMNWGKRMVALGLVARPDILAMVAATDKDDRKALDAHCERAAEAGGATARRDLGTAIHKLVERKIAEPSWEVPDLYADDVAAIIAAVDASGFDIVTEYSEIVVVMDRHQIGGTADLILRRRFDGMLVVADIKTGSSVKYGALAWAIQLAVYAHADAIYTQGPAKDGSEDRRVPMPDNIDRAAGLILHCEPGSGRCDVHILDIARGAEALDVAMSVRNWRKERDLLIPFKVSDIEAPQPMSDEVGEDAPEALPSHKTASSPTPIDDPLHAERVAWILRRIEAIRGEGHTQTLGRSWPKEGLAKPGDVRKGTGTWTPEDLPEVIRLVDACEARWEMSFGESDPAIAHDQDAKAAEKAEAEAERAAELEAQEAQRLAPSPDDGTAAPPAWVETLRRQIASMDEALRDHVIGWSKQAQTAGCAWNMGKTPTNRRAQISASALALAETVDLDADDPDELVRAALRYIGVDPQDHPVGAVLGTLTAEQAAAAVAAIDTAVVQVDDTGTPQLVAAA